MGNTAQPTTDLTWVQTTLPSATYWSCVCYGNGKFVAVDSYGDKPIYSLDGINWAQATSSPKEFHSSAVCYGDGKFVAVPDSGNNEKIMYSVDGMSWTEVSTPFTPGFDCVCYGNGKFVALKMAVVANNLAYSTDGINWTLSSMPRIANWQSVCYGNGKFVALTNYNENYGSGEIAAYSTDGVNWTETTLPAGNSRENVCYGNGIFLSVGSRMVTYTESEYDVVYSEDGITWKRATLPPTVMWKHVCYGNGKFVATGESTNIAICSTDGINWTETSLPVSESWGAMCYGGDKFVALSSASNVAVYALSAEEKSGPPTENTPGAVGEIYVDPKTGLRWECTESYTKTYYKGTQTFYNWVERGLDPEFVVDGLNDEDAAGKDEIKKALDSAKAYADGLAANYDSKGAADQALTNAKTYADAKIKSNALPVRLDLYTNVCANESGNYTLPSSITLTEGDEYVLQYQYLVNNVEDHANSIFAVAAVTDGVVRWGSSSPDNSITLTSTQVTDTWCPSDNTHRGVYTIYKVEKVVDDDERNRYHLMTLEGYDTIAPGLNAHVEGFGTVASGTYSHAEGTNTVASGDHSHAEGFNTKASGPKQHVEGMYNVADSDGKYVHIVGNGQDGSSRSNAHTLDWSGNAWFAGNVEAKAIIVASSTSGSTKRFKITVNDEGALTATEVTA